MTIVAPVFMKFIVTKYIYMGVSRTKYYSALTNCVKIKGKFYLCHLAN